MESTEQFSEWSSENLDPIGIAIRLSEILPIMSVEQAEREEEISTTIMSLSLLKITAAARSDRNKFNLIQKQQIQVAEKGARLIQEIADNFK